LFVSLFLGLAGSISGGSISAAAENLAAIKIGYLEPLDGLIIEAAEAEGYFQQEGLTLSKAPLTAGDLEIINPLEFSALVGNHRFLKLVGRGVKVGVTAGLYSGFLEILGQNANPGKITLVTSDPGGGPAAAAARYYQSKGVNIATDITWLTKDAEQLEGAVLTKEATVLARWEKRAAHHHGSSPAETLSGVGSDQAETENESRTEPANHSHHHQAAPSSPSHHQPAAKSAAAFEPLTVIFRASDHLPKAPAGVIGENPHAGHTSNHHFYESFVVILPDTINRDPAVAASITRALIRGAKWVGENQGAAAQLGLAKGLWSSSAAAEKLSAYMWMPRVSQAKEHLKIYIHQWRARQLIAPDTDESQFFNQIFWQALPDLT
jgi:hypothetical protein